MAWWPTERRSLRPYAIKTLSAGGKSCGSALRLIRLPNGLRGNSPKRLAGSMRQSISFHDRDQPYGDVFTRRVRSMGIRERPTAPRSPRQNGHAERLIASIRRECLDHVVVFGERHLRHLLRSYMQYYNDARTHLSLSKDAPEDLPRRCSARPVATAAMAASPLQVAGDLHVRVSRGVSPSAGDDPRIRTDAPESDHVRATCTSCNLARPPTRRAESMTRFLAPRCRLAVFAFARRDVELYALLIGSGARALGQSGHL